jgi:hypothetical protein
MNIEIMQLAISILRDVEANQLPFRTEAWFIDGNNASDCTTAACAAGWLCRDPRMQKLGLKIAQNGDISYPEFDTSVGFSAMAKLLKIQSSDSEYLFYRSSYSAAQVTAGMIADRMEQMINNYNKEA